MKNIFIGLFVTGAIAIMVSMVLFLKPKLGDGRKTLQVRFANIAGIVVGTRVTFAGKPVGEVVSIQEIQDARSQNSDETGRIYFYLLALKIDSSVAVYNTDEIAIRTTGLMGEKSIAILPKAPPIGKSAQLIDGEILTANSLDPLENTFNQMSRVANRMEGAIGQFDHWFEENSQALSHTIYAFDAAFSQFGALIPTVQESAKLLNENLLSLHSSLEEDQLLHKLASLTDNLDRAAESFNADGSAAMRHLSQLTGDLANGTGTLGRLLTGEDFYLRCNSLFSKAETLMNDINHYGLLFQYDKHWQRSRTKKANLLQALDTPKEFRNYFEGEVDSITTSLGRLAELLDRSEGVEEREKIASNEDFKRRFGALMRSVQSLADSIKLFNEGLVAKAASE